MLPQGRAEALVKQSLFEAQPQALPAPAPQMLLLERRCRKSKLISLVAQPGSLLSILRCSPSALGSCLYLPLD